MVFHANLSLDLSDKLYSDLEGLNRLFVKVFLRDYEDYCSSNSKFDTFNIYLLLRYYAINILSVINTKQSQLLRSSLPFIGFIYHLD